MQWRPSQEVKIVAADHPMGSLGPYEHGQSFIRTALNQSCTKYSATAFAHGFTEYSERIEVSLSPVVTHSIGVVG